MATDTFRYSRSAPKSGWCFWCRRAVVFDDMEARRLDSDEWMCGDCWAKADVGPDVSLDYMEDDDDGREGQPEFNGAFGG